MSRGPDLGRSGGTNTRSKKDLYVLDLPAAVRSSATSHVSQPHIEQSLSGLSQHAWPSGHASKSLHSRCQSARRTLYAERRNWSSRSQRPNAGDTTTVMEWWSQTGSNRRPEACKATALPTELWPRLTHMIRSQPPGPSLNLVGLGRLELPTSRLSSARSNQLSYKPGTQGRTPAPKPIRTVLRPREKEKRRRRVFRK